VATKDLTTQSINLKTIDKLDYVEFSGKDFKLIINKNSGNISKLIYHNQDYIIGELKPDFWRAPTDNDYGNDMVKRMGLWKDVYNSSIVKSFDIKTTDQEVMIFVKRLLTDIDAEFNSTYTITGDFKVKVDNHFILAPYIPVPNLPRIGMLTEISEDMNKVEWYGRGPHENYADRKTSARIGTYRSIVEDLYFPYIRPQENGYRTDIRWISFTNENGKGIKIEGLPFICFNASFYGPDQYSHSQQVDYKHTIDMTKEDRIYLNVDHKQMGVGGDNSWGAEVHTEYRVLPHEYQYGFVISKLGN